MQRHLRGAGPIATAAATAAAAAAVFLSCLSLSGAGKLCRPRRRARAPILRLQRRSATLLRPQRHAGGVLVSELPQQDAAVDSSQRFLDIASKRYKLGIDNYLSVITAQAILLNNRRTAATLRLNQMNATVLLIKALGGGWEASQLAQHPGKSGTGKPRVN